MEDITKVQVFFLSITCRAGTVHDKAGEMDIVSSALKKQTLSVGDKFWFGSCQNNSGDDSKFIH